MNITVFPKKLSGQVIVPPSKSVAHRMVIAAALSNGVSEITNLYPSVDIPCDYGLHEGAWGENRF